MQQYFSLIWGHWLKKEKLIFKLQLSMKIHNNCHSLKINKFGNIVLIN